VAFHWIGKSEDGSTITLHRLNPSHFKFPTYFTSEWESKNAELIRTGCALDVETSGLKLESSKIIEIGIRPFKFNRETGEILELQEGYTGFQDPEAPLNDEVKKLTSISDEMLKGQSINWTKVDEILSQCQIIVAHNAAFDRPFIDRSSKVSPSKIWGCSFKQVDWNTKGFPSQKLEILALYHGFFTDAHRALTDSDALIYLLALNDPDQKSPYFLELLTQAKKVTTKVLASGAPFETKDLLKDRSYRWDSQNRNWWKEIDQNLLGLEIEWLEEFIYRGPFRGKTIEIAPSEHFKGPLSSS